jgi:hypothetical protein
LLRYGRHGKEYRKNEGKRQLYERVKGTEAKEKGMTRQMKGIWKKRDGHKSVK